MATVYGIEVAGETYDIEDTNAREGVQTNANDIDNIQAVVPSSASASNKLTTEDDLPNISIRTVDLSAGAQFTLNAHSEALVVSGEVTLNEGEIPIGVAYFDGAYGGDAYKLVTKGFRINFNSGTRKASLTAFMGNVTDSSLIAQCNAIITVMKIS